MLTRRPNASWGSEVTAARQIRLGRCAADLVVSLCCLLPRPASPTVRGQSASCEALEKEDHQSNKRRKRYQDNGQSRAPNGERKNFALSENHLPSIGGDRGKRHHLADMRSHLI